MNKKTLSGIGMIIALAVIILGILFMTGNIGADTRGNWESYSTTDLDHGYASFGADFYTIVTNNAAAAASASRAASSNIRNLGNSLTDLIKTGFGAVLLAFGLFMFFHFGLIFVECPKPEPAVLAASEPEASGEAGNADAQEPSVGNDELPAPEPTATSDSEEDAE